MLLKGEGIASKHAQICGLYGDNCKSKWNSFIMFHNADFLQIIEKYFEMFQQDF
jgi:hypothetical protein